MSPSNRSLNSREDWREGRQAMQEWIGQSEHVFIEQQVENPEEAREESAEWSEQSFREQPGEGWARWTYSSGEWARFGRIDMRFQLLPFWGLLACIAFILLWTVLPWFLWSPDSALFVVVFTLATFIWIAPFFLWLAYFSIYLDARKRHKARRKGPRMVTFAKKGMWLAGTFFPFNDGPVALKRVTLNARSSVLQFYLSGTGEPWASLMPLQVLIPQGKEREANVLLERWQAEVIGEKKKEQERQKEEAARRLYPLEPQGMAQPDTAQPAQGIIPAGGRREEHPTPVVLDLVSDTDFQETVCALETRIATLEEQYSTALRQLTEAQRAIKELQDR